MKRPCRTWTSLSSKSGGSCLASASSWGEVGYGWGQGAQPHLRARPGARAPCQTGGVARGWGRGERWGGCAPGFKAVAPVGSETSAPGPGRDSVMWPDGCELPAAAENKQMDGLMDRWTGCPLRSSQLVDCSVMGTERHRLWEAHPVAPWESVLCRTTQRHPGTGTRTWELDAGVGSSGLDSRRLSALCPLGWAPPLTQTPGAVTAPTGGGGDGTSEAAVGVRHRAGGCPAWGPA